MKNDLTCPLVRDLLPLYVDGLTAPETAQAVDRHLANCPACTALRDELREPLPVGKPAEAADREVDYLKKLKRKNRLRVALAVLCVIAVMAGGLAAKIFLIGTPLQTQSFALRTYVDEENTLHLIIDSVESAAAFYGWDVENTKGSVSVTGRRVEISPFHKEGWGRIQIPLGGVSEVSLCGRIVYQDGLLIGPAAANQYEARVSYVGDAPALGRLADTFALESSFAPYTMELFTSREPYRWTLHFQKPSSADGLICLNMSCQTGPLFLALVDNLEEVGWTYTDKDGNAHDHVITLEEVNARLPELTALYNQANGTDWQVKSSVKEYAASPADLQRLSEILNYDTGLCWGENSEEVFSHREFGKPAANVDSDGRCLNLHRSHS